MCVHRCVPTCSTLVNGGRQWKSVKSRPWYKEAPVLCCCCLVAQLSWILRDPVNCSLPSSSVHSISQARILEWVAISYSRGSSQLRYQTIFSCGSCIAKQTLLSHYISLVSVLCLWFSHTDFLGDLE